MASTKNVSKELDWFYFETKLHGYITNRLDPVLKQIQKEREHNENQDRKIK